MLKKIQLAKDIKRALDNMESRAKSGEFKTPDAPNEYLGRKIAKAIDNYIREADVEGEHIMPTLQMNLGVHTLEYAPPYATPTPGTTITMGPPVPMSNKGPFGKDCFPGGKGKIQ